MSRRSAFTCCMYHHARRRRSSLAASSSASSLRLPRVGTRIDEREVHLLSTLSSETSNPCRRPRPPDLRPARLGHRPLQLPLPVLHARGRAALARARRDPRFEEIERLVRLLARMGVDRRSPDRRRAARAARVPAPGRRCSRGSTGIEDLSLTTNGYLLERDAAALVDAGINRVNVSIDSLQRDRFFQITRRDSLPQVLRGLEAIGAPRSCSPIKVNAVALRDFTEQEALPVRRVRPLDRATRCASSSSCRSTATTPGPPTQVLTGEEMREIIDARPPARGAAARAVSHRARLPLRGRHRRDRLHQPGLRALLRGLQPHPPDRRRQAAHLPLLDPRDRPARAAARGASDAELEP